jgi:hypothetical protein
MATKKDKSRASHEIRDPKASKEEKSQAAKEMASGNKKKPGK